MTRQVSKERKLAIYEQKLCDWCYAQCCGSDESVCDDNANYGFCPKGDE